MAERDVFVTTALKTGGGYVNPAVMGQHPDWRPDWVAYVLHKTSEDRTRPTRVITASGPLLHSGGELHGLALKLGDVIRLRHADSGIILGTYEIAGINRADTGLALGEVPNRMIRRCTA